MSVKTYKPYILILTTLVAGCTLGPKYETPDIDIPCEWHTDSSNFADCPDENFIWWKSFNDPTLDSLIDRASAQNLDLYLAASRILEARLARKGGEANGYPRIDASATYGHVQYNQKVLNNLLGNIGSNKHNKSKTTNRNIFEVGFDAEWEIDLFGANAHEVNALKANLEASVESFYSVWVTLSSEVARNYIELRGFQKRVELLNRNIETQKDTLTTIEGLQKTGFVSSIDQIQAEQQLNELLAEKPLLELSVDKSIHRLSILLGYAPGDLYCELSESSELPFVPEEKPLCLPSELLRRRPDIRKAERDLAASTERIGSAVASLFPRISLRGFIGDITSSMHTPGYTSFIGPQLLLPIFNSRLLTQDVEFNKIKTQQALYEYQKTVLDALEETENAIATYHYELKRYQSLAAAQKSNNDVYSNTFQLYQHGFKDYLEVLVSNRTLLATEDALLQSEIELLLNYISLYKAMGGEWKTCCEDCGELK